MEEIRMRLWAEITYSPDDAEDDGAGWYATLCKNDGTEVATTDCYATRAELDREIQLAAFGATLGGEL